MKDNNFLLKKENNNITLIRQILAIFVIFYHSFGMIFYKKYDINFFLSKQQSNTGGLAIHMFFIISGFFIARSFVRTKNSLDYIYSRFLRIFPGLIVSCWFCALVIGPLATSLSIKEYFSDPRFSNYIFNNSYNILRINNELPGVFLENRIGNGVNGSLWTITYEIYYYGFIFIAGLLKLFNKKYFFVFLWVILIFLSYISNLDTIFITFCCFLSGVVSYLFFEKINFRNNYVFVFILCSFVITYWYGKYFYLCFSIFGAYFVFFLAFKRKILKKLDNIGDLSYGLYIYAFPIQQLLISKNASIHPISLFVLSFIPTLILALLSWNFIEKPFLNIKKKENTNFYGGKE